MRPTICALPFFLIVAVFVSSDDRLGRAPAAGPSSVPATYSDPEVTDENLHDFIEAGKWGRPSFAISRLPTTPTYPVGWLSTGQVFLLDGEYRMKLDDIDGSGWCWSVDLKSGRTAAHLPEREVKAVICRIGLQLPAD